MRYSKYDASGNTFVIFHTDEKKDYSKLAIKLCAKDTFDTDGLIVVIPHKSLDFQWLFYNKDGSTASMCGNGTRAVALYAYTNKLANNKMTFLTGAGNISCEVQGNIVETQMGKPVEIKKPFSEDGYDCWIVDTGVPHVVIMTDDISRFDTNVCAKFREKYDANVNFACVKDGKLFVRTFERGVEGETQACGTGMVASFLRANNLNLIDNIAKVYPTSKEELTIRQQNGTIYFKGTVKYIGSKDL